MSWVYAVWTDTGREEGSGLSHSVAAVPSVPSQAVPVVKQMEQGNQR